MIAAAQDRIFHTDLNLANLRQRNALSRIADKGETLDFCRIETDVSRRAANNLNRANIFPHGGNWHA